MYEWLPFNRGVLDQVPKTDAERRKWLAKQNWFANPNGDLFRDKLVELYGEKGKQVKQCEAFQDSEYGTRLTKENIHYYFPFLPEN
jgi:hypothetical protein